MALLHVHAGEHTVNGSVADEHVPAAPGSTARVRVVNTEQGTAAVGLIDGRPGSFWTISGRMFPDVPMIRIREGDVARMRIVNDSDEVHPMHLHGHHADVLSRDGVATSGSPWCWANSATREPDSAGT